MFEHPTAPAQGLSHRGTERPAEVNGHTGHPTGPRWGAKVQADTGAPAVECQVGTGTDPGAARLGLNRSRGGTRTFGCVGGVPKDEAGLRVQREGPEPEAVL